MNFKKKDETKIEALEMYTWRKIKEVCIGDEKFNEKVLRGLEKI